MRIKSFTGFDVIAAVVDLTEGNLPHVQPQSEDKYLADEFIYCKPGQFDHMEGFAALKEQGIIHDYYVFKWKGASFDSVQSSGDRVGGFTIVADSFENLKKKHQIVCENVKVIDMDGNDMMRHDLLTDL